MNENRTTITFAAVAAALLALTLLTAPRHKPADVFGDQGRAFYPEFQDPLKAASLEVVEFDEATGASKRFKVALVAGKWVIPSHHNYPADAKDWAKRAATFIDLKRDKFRSDNVQQHESFNVVDPADEKAQGTKGRGKRVTLRDLDGKVLSDYVFGKDAGEGRRYVRLPTEPKRVFETKTKAEVSTKFEDWIETDLLQLNQSAIRKVVVDKYSIDEQQLLARGVLMIKDRTTTTVSREDSAKPWAVSGLKEKEEPHAENLTAMMNALDDLKIVGVRPKPPFLTRDLKASGEFKVRERLTPQQMASLQDLQRKGFFVVPQGDESHVLSNEGDVTTSCEDGVVYTLRFGEVLIGEGEELTAGAEDKKDPAKKDEKKTGKEARHLLVTARFDESLLGPAPVEPKAPEEKKPEEKKPEEKKPEEKKDEKQAEKKPEEKKPEEKKPEEKKPETPEQDQYKKDKEEYDRKKADHDKKLADGKKRAQELTDRFADWYYVISDDLFKKLRRDPKELVKPKEEKKEEKKDEHKHDEKKPEDKKDEKKPEGAKPEDKKPEEKKPEEKKPEEKKPQ